MATANFVAVVALAALGVREIRRGNLRAHRRRMLGAASLVALFLVSYVAKVAILGKEDRSAWSAGALGLLYVHELCILVMLLAGGYAGYCAWRFRATLGAGVRLEQRRSPARAAHRRAGWIAVLVGALGCATAAGVLLGMYARSG